MWGFPKIRGTFVFFFVFFWGGGGGPIIGIRIAVARISGVPLFGRGPHWAVLGYRQVFLEGFAEACGQP